jgi:glutaminase
MVKQLLSTRRRRFLTGAAATVLAGGLVLSAQGPDPQTAVNNAFTQFKDLKEGKNADYIPALAKVNPNLFGIALVTADGKVYTAGDVTTEVSIQSISKVFTMAQVIQEQGLDAIEKRIGVDATGARFIDHRRRRRPPSSTRAPEMNPLVNRARFRDQHGHGRQRQRRLEQDHRVPQRRAGRQLAVLRRLQVESDSNQRNQAIGALMLVRLHQEQLAAGRVCTRQCSIGVNARTSPRCGHATRAAEPRHRQAGDGCDKVPGVLAVMATAGLYDDSGSGVSHRPARQERSAAASRGLTGKFGIAVVRRRSTMRQRVRQRRLPPFRTPLAAIPTSPGN